jgi:hypothetical protein
MKTLNDIKGLLNEVSGRIKDGEKEVMYKTDQHCVSYYEGYVSGLTWVEEILGHIVEELDKDTVTAENLWGFE